MEYIELFRKVIKKAENNGFDFLYEDICYNRNDLREIYYRHLIFDHNFIKAFFKRDKWKKRLQEMVIEKEPLKYLEKFL